MVTLTAGGKGFGGGAGFHGNPGIGVVDTVTFCVEVVDGGGGHVHGGVAPAALTAPLKIPNTPALCVTTIGGLGEIVVKIGKSALGAGTVALPPVPNCGCVKPGVDGGTAAGVTGCGVACGPTGTATGALLGESGGNCGGGGTPPAGGGVGVVKSGKKVDAAGAVALPLLNLVDGSPVTDGGTGAG